MTPISDFLGITDVIWTGFPEAAGIILLVIGPLLIGRFIGFVLRIVFRVANLHGEQMEMTGKEVAQKYISINKIGAIIRTNQGVLCDCYDPDDNIIYLSNAVFFGRTPAAYAIALHETGHAIQHKESYKPEQLRSVFGNISIIFALGGVMGTVLWIFFSCGWALTVSVISLCIYLLIQIVTVTAEIDASRRAKEMLSELCVSEAEFNRCRGMLGLCYWTYIISIISTLSAIALLIIMIAKEKKA